MKKEADDDQNWNPVNDAKVDAVAVGPLMDGLAMYGVSDEQLIGYRERFADLEAGSKEGYELVRRGLSDLVHTRTKIEARRTGQPLADGNIKTACEQACPTQAIVFGDLNDPKSRVAGLATSGRAYRVLEELGTAPAVRYLKVVRHDTSDGKR